MVLNVNIANTLSKVYIRLNSVYLSFKKRVVEHENEVIYIHNRIVSHVIYHMKPLITILNGIVIEDNEILDLYRHYVDTFENITCIRGKIFTFQATSIEKFLKSIVQCHPDKCPKHIEKELALILKKRQTQLFQSLKDTSTPLTTVTNNLITDIEKLNIDAHFVIYINEKDKKTVENIVKKYTSMNITIIEK